MQPPGDPCEPVGLDHRQDGHRVDPESEHGLPQAAKRAALQHDAPERREEVLRRHDRRHSRRGDAQEVREILREDHREAGDRVEVLLVEDPDADGRPTLDAGAGDT